MFDGRIISGITIFVAVAQAGTYARAAEHVGLSRSGIGKSIARLEYRTGMRLFDRTSRALKLTDEGRAFLEEVVPLLERLGKAAAPARSDKVRGHLRVTCDAAFGTFLLMPALHLLVKQHPRLKVDLLIRDRLDNPLAEGMDVAVRFGEPMLRDLHKRLLFHSRIVTCASAAYVERHGIASIPEDLLVGHTCIRLIDDVTGKPHTWQFVTQDGEQREIAPDCNLTVNDAPSLMDQRRRRRDCERHLQRYRRAGSRVPDHARQALSAFGASDHGRQRPITASARTRDANMMAPTR